MNILLLEKVGKTEINQVDVFSRLLENRVIFIEDLYDDRTATDVVAVLLYLDRESSDKITIFINSGGGDIRNIFAIYDAMKMISAPIETFCVGACEKESVLLLASGTPGHRFVGKNADICVGQLVSPFFEINDLTNTKINHEKCIKDNDNFLKALSKNTGKPLKELKKSTERAIYLTPQQAISFGIADKAL